MSPSTKNAARALAPALAIVTLLACGNARTPEQYRDSTAQVLAARNDDVRSCYDAAFKADAKAEGTVSVQFKIQADTGKFVDAKVVGGTAPDAVKQCVLKAIDGLTLSPADARDGEASFVWEFSAPKPTG